jgi:carboxymethylenebutenolidase
MGETLTLTAEDGHKFSAYKATPSGVPRGGIVVVQEIFGVNQHIRKVADSFAADGYVAIAPALFDRVERNFETGYGPQDIERGRATRGKLSTDQALMDVKATVKELAKGGQKVGVVGYCFGGTIAWLSSTRVDGVSAAVGYYGGGVPDAAEEKPKSPVMLHFGETDASIPMDAVEKVKKAQPSVPIYVYAGAGHGFVCDERGSYQADAAKQARERTIDFFRKHIG